MIRAIVFEELRGSRINSNESKTDESAKQSRALIGVPHQKSDWSTAASNCGDENDALRSALQMLALVGGLRTGRSPRWCPFRKSALSPGSPCLPCRPAFCRWRTRTSSRASSRSSCSRHREPCACQSTFVVLALRCFSVTEVKQLAKKVSSNFDTFSDCHNRTQSRNLSQ